MGRLRENPHEVQALPTFVRILAKVAAKAKERQATSTGGTNPQLRPNWDKAEKGRTDEELAKLANVSKNTVRRAKVIEAGIPITG